MQADSVAELTAAFRSLVTLAIAASCDYNADIKDLQKTS
jgi:hypothetical protein